MKTRLAVLALFMALVAGCDDGVPFHDKDATALITIGRNLGGNEDVFTSIASKEYHLEWKERVIIFRCPCYLGDDTQWLESKGAVAMVKTAEIKVELLPDAEYDISVRESGKTTRFSFPRIKP